VRSPGHNSRLDEVQAEILRRKLDRLDDNIADATPSPGDMRNASATSAGRGGLSCRHQCRHTHVYYVYVVSPIAAAITSSRHSRNTTSG